jgi:hypothetical protein
MYQTLHGEGVPGVRKALSNGNGLSALLQRLRR